MEEFKTYLDRIQQPISDESLFGTEIPRSNPDYVQVRKKINYFTPGQAKQAFDGDEQEVWGEILEHCTVILESVSKHILIYCFFTCAALEKFGFIGFNRALIVFNDIFQSAYPDLFPHKPKMQYNAFRWFGEYLEYRLAKFVRDIQVSSNLENLTPEEKSAIAECPEILGVFVETVKQTVPDAVGVHPKFTNLVGWIMDLPALIQEEPVESGSSAEDTGSAGELNKDTSDNPEEKNTQLTGESAPQKEAAANAPVSSEETSVSEPLPVLEEISPHEVVHSLIKLAAVIRKQRLDDPMAYKILRTAIWTNISGLPPRQPPKSGQSETEVTRRMIKKPNAVHSLQKIILDQKKKEQLDPEKFLESLENYASGDGMAYWIDLHYTQWKSCENLGFKQAARVIAEETLNFTSRMGEEIFTAEFADGTPFVGEAAKSWLESNRKKESKVSSTSFSGRAVKSGTIQFHAMKNDETLSQEPSLEEILERLTKCENDFILRWKLLLKSALIISQDLNTLDLALAITESCQRFAVETRIADACPTEFTELQFYSREMKSKLVSAGILSSQLQISDHFFEYVHSVLWKDPVRFLTLEFGLDTK